MDNLIGITVDGKSVLKISGDSVQMSETFIKGSVTDKELEKLKKDKKVVPNIKSRG